MKKSLITLAAFGIAAATTPVSAQSVDIEYSDLDLTSAKGQAKLERRINDAAKRICGHTNQRTGSRMQSRAMKKCVARTKQSARAQMAEVVDDSRLGG